jgi:hypothetical protein
MELTRKYELTDALERALSANIRKACAAFLRARPEFYACELNERILFSAMEAADYLSPTSVSSWEIVYSENRDKLIEAPDVRKQTRRVAPAAPAPTSLTLKEINSWTAKHLQNEVERSPRRAAEIDSVLSSGR